MEYNDDDDDDVVVPVFINVGCIDFPFCVLICRFRSMLSSCILLYMDAPTDIHSGATGSVAVNATTCCCTTEKSTTTRNKSHVRDGCSKITIVVVGVAGDFSGKSEREILPLLLENILYCYLSTSNNRREDRCARQRRFMV